MKKVILFFLVVGFLFPFSTTFADIVIPFEYQCAVVRNGKCLYTNEDKMTRSEKYLQGEKYLQEERNKQRPLIIKGIVIILLCGLLVYLRRRKKNK